ncbi:MAG TPA: pentapeptide repeat-containing protein [Methylocella sp.]
MSDRSDDPESGAGEPKPPKTKAEDNPWYLLATLYGVPELQDDELKNKNRDAWNRYFARNLDEPRRAQLITMKRHSLQELTPAPPEKVHEIEAAFAARCKSLATSLALPLSDSNIDFSNVQFDRYVTFERYFFFDKAEFENTVFNGQAEFIGATFLGIASFENATFSGMAAFDSAGFASPAIFQGANFTALTLFGYATFFSMAYFVGATFSRGNPYGNTSFVRAKFYGEANFLLANFGGSVNFEKAEFFRTVGFLKATFARSATFARVAFFDDVNFDTATFSEKTVFADAVFNSSSHFINAELKGITSFEGTTFKTVPPQFFNAKLHQGTVWRGVTWPPAPKEKDRAGTSMDSYACLKLEMDRLKKHEDELDFFALELQSRSVLLGPWRGLPISLYGVLSEYGRSYARPFLWLLAVAAIGAVLLVFSDALPIEKSFGLSFAITLNVFGFRKDFFDSHYIENLPAALKILAAVQTMLGTILLFLFGLGIRNKFRMK